MTNLYQLGHQSVVHTSKNLWLPYNGYWFTKLGVPQASVPHILDDFIFVSPGKAQCALFQSKFHYLCKDLNLPIKHEKNVLPTTSADLHGLRVDSVLENVYLPPDKCEKALGLLTEMRHRRKVSLKQLQALTGTLDFATRTIPMGRSFLQHLIDLTVAVARPHHHIRLSAEARRDIAAWTLFLQHFNGSLMFQQWLRLCSGLWFKVGLGPLASAVVALPHRSNGIVPSSSLFEALVSSHG